MFIQYVQINNFNIDSVFFFKQIRF